MTRNLVALLVGIALAIASAAAAQPAQASEPSTVTVVAKAKVKIAVAIKKPSAKCGLDTKRKLILAPSNRQKICYIESLVLGHAYPAPKAAGYLQKVAKKLKAGKFVTYQGHIYKVKAIRSIKKEKLFSFVVNLSGTDRYLVTCDTKKGYKHHHAINNLVVQLVLV
jgi:hypothetical protein